MPPTKKETEEPARAYRFGDQGQKPAWDAVNQIFVDVVVRRHDLDEHLGGEFVLLQTGSAGPIAFVDLVRGTIIPFSSVVLAVPA